MDSPKLSACLRREHGAEESWAGSGSREGGREESGKPPQLVSGRGAGVRVIVSMALVRNHTLRD